MLWNWHHDAMCEYLEAVYYGQILRLLINVPPRYLKSNICTVAFPTWVWTKQADHRFMMTSHSQSLSTKHSRDRRTLIQSDWYQEGYGGRYSLAGSQDTVQEFGNDKRGHMIATSLHGTATGKGCDTLIADDPLDPKKIFNAEQCASENELFDLKFVGRLDNKKTGRIVVVMQRLHQNDLCGHLKEQGYTQLVLPGEAEHRHTVVFPRSGETKVMEPGEVLHPEREGPVEIAAQKKALGAWGFAAQYNQNPTTKGGVIIKRDWIKYYKVLPMGLTGHRQSWDMAFKDTESSSYVVGGLWAKRAGDYYLLDLVRDRMGFSATRMAMIAFSAKHPKVIRKVVEEKANGAAIIDSLKQKLGGIIAYRPTESKEARLEAVSPLFEAGNVWLPDPSIAPWVNDYVNELCGFPFGAHNDQVDMTSQALLDFTQGGGDVLSKMVQL